MLLGRDRERQVVDELVAGARIGGGGVLAITGEAGVGKTALLEHAVSRLGGVRLLRVTGTEPEQGIGFAGLHSLLRPLLSFLPQVPEPQAAALSGALALAPGSGGDRFAIGAATLSVLCRAAEDGPVAVVVDDVQLLLDRPSAEALAFAARRLGSDPVVVLLAGRAGECEDLLAGLPVLRLEGLDEAASHELVTSRLGVRLTAEHVARLHGTTGGNPLALLELGHDLDALVRTGPGLPPPVPARLVESFTRRLGPLRRQSRTALLVAVVTGGDPRLGAATCRLLDLGPQALTEPQAAGLVSVTPEAVTFRHPLLRAAVYAAAGAQERALVHRTVAGLLPPEQADRRAWHLAEACDEPDAEVAGLLEQAAERAVARSAYAAASAAYERAARLTPASADHRGRLTRAATAAWEAGMVEHASGLLDELAPLELRHDDLAAMMRLRAAIAARTGSLVQARDMLERAAAAATGTELRIELLADAERVSMYLVDAPGNRRLARRLEEEVAATGSVAARGVGLTACGMAKVLTGEGGTEELLAAIPLLASGQSCTTIRPGTSG